MEENQGNVDVLTPENIPAPPGEEAEGILS